MGAESLFRKAEKYRLIARSINDAQALMVLQQMAQECEARARRMRAQRSAQRLQRKAG
jgi:hypothetical protein